MLLRHGKSDWDTTNRGDRNRPLSRRGERASATMGLVLGRWARSQTGSCPRRPCGPKRRPRLHGSREDGIRLSRSPRISTEPDRRRRSRSPLAAAADAERLMLVGHEPTWSYLAERITGGRIAVRTATVLAFDLDAGSWDEAPRSRGTLAYALHPRMFDQSEWALQ